MNEIARPFKYTMILPSAETMTRLRMESAMTKQAESSKPSIPQLDVICEVCFSKIHHYTGPPEGIICSSCFRPQALRASARAGLGDKTFGFNKVKEPPAEERNHQKPSNQ